MNPDTLTADLEEALAEQPLLDIHTHLVGGRLGARGLHDVLLYHMVVSDLYAAGCPHGERLSQFPREPSREEARDRIEAALPFLPHIQNTSSAWAVRLILGNLYDWNQPIRRDNWRQLDDRIRERADDRSWHHQLLDRLRIRRTGTEWARRGPGEDDDRLQYALEWGFFTRCQWGEFDTALYELERCWGRAPESPTPIGAGERPATERTLQSLEDVRQAVRHYVEAMPHGQIMATAIHLSTDIDYQPVDEETMARALSRRSEAWPRERDAYASYVHERFLEHLEPHADTITLQFSLGAEPLPHETGSRLRQETLRQLADMIARHPRIRFQCFLASRHANQSLCTLARQLPNLSLAGCWWHNFFPDTARQVLAERLDMLPANRQIAFFSDAYCLEWTYAKLWITRRLLAQVLGERVARRQYSWDDALATARAILFESPQSLLGMTPRPGSGQ